MSNKMPAKKKSCFQITSVTQAQVAGANSVADDTESPDGDRGDGSHLQSENVSEILFGVSRADYESACARSSSEETFNNGDHPEVHPPGFMALPHHIPQQLSALPCCAPNGWVPLIINQAGIFPPAVVTSSIPTSTTTSTTVSCSSRFRVIKLDHGTGEPFRRGRWTCMEFYEKADSEAGGSVVSRTVDSIRHANANALDPSADRDSGLGLTGGSVVAGAPSTLSGQGLDSVADAALAAPHNMHPVETLQQQLHHQSYGVGQQQAVATGTTMPNAFSNNNISMTGPTQHQPVVVGNIQPAAPQNLLPVGHNGLPQAGVHIQKSPSMHLPAALAQTLSYPQQQQQHIIQQQLPLGHQHHLPNHQSSGGLPPQNHQADYYQQQHQPVMQQAVASTLPVTGLCVGQPVGQGQGPSPVMTAAAVGGPLILGGHVGEMAGVVGVGSLPVSQSFPGLLQQQTSGGMGGVGVSMLGGGGLQQQYAPSGQQQPQPLSLHSAPSSGVHQNVPAAVAGITSVPSSTVPASMPSDPSVAHAIMPNLNPSPSLLLMQQAAHHMPCNGGGAPGSLGGGGVQGLSTTAGFFGQVVEESVRQAASEGLASRQPPGFFSGKDLIKPFIPESLQLASSPSVNSLFGIPIPMDGDEDRKNPSMAFYQAFQSGSSRLRDSKAHSDSASGASVVAIDNKIEQAMDLVKSHLMYAVREEVEVLKEQIKELFERNSMLERENAVLKSVANSDQLSQLSVQPAAASNSSCSTTPPQQAVGQPPQPQSQLPPALAGVPQAQPQPQPQPHLQPQAQQQQLQSQPQLLDPSQQPQQQPPPNVTSA